MLNLIPEFYTSGTHYECGFNTGKKFESRIRKYLELFTDFEKYLLPLIDSNDGNKIVSGFLLNLERTFPWYVDEMRGIADGTGLPFEYILALNFRVELLHVTKNKEECEILIEEELEELLMECSDFCLSNKENNLILHNEDASIAIYETGYFVTYKTVSKNYGQLKSPEEEFTCYCYPGHLPGNAFAFNSAGFTFSVNALLPKKIALNRFPRQIVSRYMLSAKNLEDLESILLNTPIAFGFCLTLGYFGDDLSKLKTNWNSEYYFDEKKENCEVQPKIWNYELALNETSAKSSKVSKHCLISNSNVPDLLNKSKYYSVDYCYHFNHYERIEITQCVVNSSLNRKKRADEITPPQSLNELLLLAYDDKDEKYPIYRIKADSLVQCIGTALFDLNQKKLLIYNGRISRNEPQQTILMSLAY